MKETTPDKAIVIGCGTAGLAVIRALSPFKEVEIIGLAHTRSEIGCVSRYISKVAYCPHPGREEEAFIDFLMRRGEEWNGALLFEAGDYMAVAVSRHKRRLQQHYRTAIADWPVLKTVIEKATLYQLAAACGVPYPQTFCPRTVGEIDAIRHLVQYPCLLKPVNSHLFVSRYGVKNFEIAHEAALIREFRRCQSDHLEVLVQEIIPGPDSCLERVDTYVNSQGRSSAQFFANKLRQHPPRFGVTRVAYSTGRNAETAALSERMLKRLDYRGYASVEFKRDPRDGRLKLMEINVRMVRPGFLAVAAGVNFPWIMYQDLVKREQVYVDQYKEGVFWIEILPDLLNMLVNPYREERHSLREYARPYLSRHKTFAVLDWKDPRPFLKQAWNATRWVGNRWRTKGNRRRAADGK